MGAEVVIVRLALVLLWLSIIPFGMWCATRADAARNRKPLLVRACPTAGDLPDPRACAVGYAEGSVDPMDRSWPTREAVCAELVKRCL